MTLDGLMDRAWRVRQLYAQLEAERHGRSWTPQELALGFVGDVGDLAKLVQAKAGVRRIDDLDAKLAHELADCLWSVLTLARTFDVDLAAAFAATMDELEAGLTARR